MGETGQLPWIDEDAIAAAHPVIYHYTTVDALAKIIESGGIRATHFAQTNDADEFHSLRSIFPELMAEPALLLAKKLRAQGAFKRAPSNDALRRIIPADARSFHDAMVRALPLPFHLTCFSKHTQPQHEENGLLTLWRFYGGDGRGVALGFNTRKLIDCTYKLMQTHAIQIIYLDEVRYGSEDSVLRGRLKDATGITEMFLQFVENLVTGRELDFESRREELLQFTVLAACAKNADFVDEREVRLVTAAPFGGSDDDSATNRRYMLLPLLGALEDIIVGPSSEQAALCQEAEQHIHSAGFGVPIRTSNTPFRYIRR